MAAAAAPPAALKEALRAETARTRQLPPVTRGTDAATRTRPRLGPRRLALTLAGAAVVAATAVWVTGTGGPGGQSPPSQEIAAVLTAPDAVTLTARVRTGGTATIVMSPGERMLVFAAAKLRRLPAAQRSVRRPARPDGGTRRREPPSHHADDPRAHALKRSIRHRHPTFAPIRRAAEKTR